MSRGPDAHTLLLRALCASAEKVGCDVTICASDLMRWESATFSGARHSVTLGATHSPRFDRWVGQLPEAEFSLRTHLVADLTVSSLTRNGDQATVTLEVLTIEER